MALQNVLNDSDNGDVSLKSFEPAVLKQGEEIHNEVRTVRTPMLAVSGLRQERLVRGEQIETLPCVPACSLMRV